MLPLPAQQLDQVVIVLDIGGLAAPPLPEHELVVEGFVPGGKAAAVHVDALFAAFAAAEDDAVSPAEIAVLHNVEPPVGAEDDAGIHAALLREAPLPVDLEILGVHGGAVEILRRDAVRRRGFPARVGRGGKARIAEIGCVVNRQSE